MASSTSTSTIYPASTPWPDSSIKLSSSKCPARWCTVIYVVYVMIFANICRFASFFITTPFHTPEAFVETREAVHSGNGQFRSTTKSKIREQTNQLLIQNLRYYVYEDPAIAQPSSKRQFWKRPQKRIMMRRYARDAILELQYIDHLERHSLRTNDSFAADVYIIPFSIGAVLACGQRTKEIYKSAFTALYNNSIFQSTLGHRHVLFANVLPTFDTGHVNTLWKWGLAEHYPKLWNVTIANDKDWEEMHHVLLDENETQSTRDFEVQIKCAATYVTSSVFSVGLGASKSDPFQLATFEKFQNSSYFIFYHTRIPESIHNSTQYRRAPLQESVIQGLPNKTSIGYDLEPTEWHQRFSDSKFCLVIRGDTPSTHALIRSVRAGCIPVLACDLCPRYSPSFKSSLQIQDFSVMIDEKRFLEDPLDELSKLTKMTDWEIREKLEWLAYAQRITQPDHPESLFVPAFLREATESYKRRLQ